MNLVFRVASTRDLELLGEVDGHISPEGLAEVVSAGRVMLAEVDGNVVGFLRWGLFWDQVPFMNLLWVRPGMRRQGFGTGLVNAWEYGRRAAGHDMVLTSTVSAEQSQHLYRRLGYVDCGALFLPGEPAEILLRKSFA